MEQRSLLTASVLSAAVPIGPPINPAQVLSSSIGNQYSDVAMDSKGDFVVVWENGSTSGNEQVFFQIFAADGQVLAGPTPVTNPGDTDYHPRVSMADNGNFVVTWTQLSNDQVYYRRFSFDGTTQDFSGVPVDADGNAQGLSDVAMYDNGDFVVAWEDGIIQSGTQIGLRYFLANGTPETPQFQSTFGSNPHIAARQGVGLVVTWQATDASGNSELLAQSFPAGGGSNPVVTISNDTSGQYIEDSGVAMNDNGDYAVVRTHHYSPTDHETYVDVRNFQGARLSSQAILVDTSATVMRPAVAIADDNSVAVSYDNASQGRAWYKLFDPSGNVISSGDVDAGNDSFFAAGAYAGYTALAMAGSGRFVVSWHQDPNADNLNQVQVRRFHADIRPVANNDVYVLSASSSSTVAPAISMIVNDTDPWGDTPQAAITNMPTLGTLSAVHQAGPLGGTFTYTKGPNFQYMDSFTYQDYDYDSNGPSNTATVTVLSQPAGVIWKFFEQVLHRDPAPSDLAFFIPLLAKYGPGVLSADFFESDELLNQIITGYYQQYLGRAPQGTDLDFWGGKWRAYGGPELIIAQFASSAEFNTLANHQYGAGSAGWVTALYDRILDRVPRPGIDVPFWQQQLAGGTTEGQVALDFVASNEGFGDDVTGWFQEYLGRAPTATEQAKYVNEMLAGASDRAIEQEITNLPEYANNPTAPSPGSAEFLPDYVPPWSSTNQQTAAVSAKDAVFRELGK